MRNSLLSAIASLIVGLAIGFFLNSAPSRPRLDARQIMVLCHIYSDYQTYRWCVNRELFPEEK